MSSVVHSYITLIWFPFPHPPLAPQPGQFLVLLDSQHIKKFAYSNRLLIIRYGEEVVKLLPPVLGKYAEASSMI